MIRVFVIDDSKMVRDYFEKIFKDEKDIKLIGLAPNPIDAINILKRKGLPHIFILDIEMPKMDGLTFLKEFTVKHKVPTIICSYLVKDKSAKAIEALKSGAVDIILKPSVNFVNYHIDIVSKIRDIINSDAKVVTIDQTSCKVKKNIIKARSIKQIIGIASSTGGIPVLDTIIQSLQPNHAPIVIVQHMQDGFTKKLAKRLDEAYDFTSIKEANDGDILMRGRVLIAKSGIHSIIVKEGTKYKVRFSRIAPVDYHKPSGTLLFESISQCAKDHAVGVVLTGMGCDGALGLKCIHDKGGDTYAQSKTSCVVFGMPKQAVAIGAVKRTSSVKNIIEAINSY
jgi:two-component system chemotaxis response regulator CheB